MTELQQAAIEYVTAGLHILALTGKKPNGRVHGESWSWEDSFWSDSALTDNDREAIEHAFALEKGTTGIAILIPKDFLVADVDTERAGALLQSLGFEYDKGATIASKTRNGVHIWFWAPGADRNRWLGDGQQPDPGRTLLFKGFGGYVAAPPSEHPDGGKYEWGVPLVKDGQMYMPDILPDGAAEQFKRDDLWAADREDAKPVEGFTLIPEKGVPWYLWKKEFTYGLEGLEKAIINAADGNQNNVIHWAALTAKEEGVPYEVAKERLLAAALKGNHPRHRALDTIKGAYKRRPRG